MPVPTLVFLSADADEAYWIATLTTCQNMKLMTNSNRADLHCAKLLKC